MVGSHLIRDINDDDDLWKGLPIQNMSFFFRNKETCLPIFKAIGSVWIKKKHSNKFKKEVDRFYDKIFMIEVFLFRLATKCQKSGLNATETVWFTYVSLNMT